ncbi:MAG: hypothetical protein DSM106950_08770 [Stigonema ocellatum SAG 48.90 = DSM 106950]|nr:hypothetical protein [Stigonema ocellatum SAG 48.90 = DSM 106950]
MKTSSNTRSHHQRKSLLANVYINIVINPLRDAILSLILIGKGFISANLEAIRDQNITRAKAAIKRVRSIRRSRRSLGVDGICEHVKDVDGNWLENWTDEETRNRVSVWVLIRTVLRTLYLKIVQLLSD